MTYEELEAILAPRFAEGWPAIVGIPDSWVDLVNDLHNELVKLDPDYKINQIKVKFGGLRYYIEHSRAFMQAASEEEFEKFRSLIWAAEEKSFDL